MNPEQWISVVKELLDEARPVDPGSYYLVVDEGKVVLRPRRGLQKYDHPLAVFLSHQVNNGLTSRRWYDVGCKLAAQKSLNPAL